MKAELEMLRITNESLKRRLLEAETQITSLWKAAEQAIEDSEPVFLGSYVHDTGVFDLYVSTTKHAGH